MTSSSTALYPIPDDPEIRKFIFGRARRARDENGKMIVPVGLSAIEREMVIKRLRVLAAGLGPAENRLIKSAVLELFSGMAATESDDLGAAATAAQFVSVLRGLPYFAIKRACDRFARGEVTAEDVGEKTAPSKAYRPSTAQLRIVAEAIARPHWDEASVGSLLLEAVVERPIKKSEDSKERAEQFRQTFQQQVAQAELADRDRTEWARLIAEAEQFNRDRDARIAEYRNNGLEPVFSDASKILVTSLSMMLRNGWRVEDGLNGKSILVRPKEIA